MLKDYFRLAWENISHRKLRSLLTIIGIVIGIAAVVALVSLGQGVQQVVTEIFQTIGTDKIFITPATGFTSSSGTTPMTDHEIRMVERTSGVKDALGIMFKSGRVYKGRDLYIVPLISSPIGEKYYLLEESWDVKYLEGRPLKTGDKYKALISYEIYKGKILDKPVLLNDKITIEGRDFDVVGIMDRTGDPDFDQGIIIPEETMKEMYDTEEYNYIMAKTEPTADPKKVADDIKRSFRKDREQKEGEEDFNVETADQLLESFGVVLSSLSAIVIGIAAISLFVGGVGIMNTMYTAVLQRTNEIGIMKAIGAKNSQIMMLFIIESGIIGLIGGTVGIGLGILLSKIIEFIGSAALNTVLLRAYFPWYLILGALAFAFLIGTLSGLLPARQASKQNPVEALRYE
jgi:putative ABC transport system permease protein